MIHFHKGSVMDATETTFSKQRFISISKPLAIIIIILFVGCIVATGLLVYHLTSNCSKLEESTVIVYNNKFTTNIDETTEPVITEENTTLNVEEQLTTTSRIEVEKVLDLRLPKSIHPHSYNIKLIPFIKEDNFTFHGEVTILINVTVASSNITLHADELIIDDVSVYNLSRQSLSIQSIEKDNKRQFLIINLEEPLIASNQYFISIKYRGILNDLLQGFYRSSYKEGNEKRWIAVTQFQATDARKAFPCFDEPALKARFQLSLARLKNMSSLSNMRRIGPPQPVKDLPEYVWDNYEESVPMSTYLVAFLISDFESITDGTFSIWARHSAISQAKYSLEVGPKILQFYENFFGIDYPLPKIDMVAVPDFSAGAMENWGLITYRESVLLYEKGVSSKKSLQSIAHVIAHELAHQWFGNLVTPSWWSDLWLNEGFATYVENLGADAVNPQLKELDQFVVNELQGAFAMDALKSSHQISAKVNNPDEINDIFDSISYSKGAAILRMMQHFLTMDVFRRSLNKYLSGRMYKSAEQDDLWQTITQESHETKVLDSNMTIKEIMDTWTLQTGFPVVTVRRNYHLNSIDFNQKRFFVSKNDSIESGERWWIPLTYMDNSKTLKRTWMKPSSSMTVSDANISNNSWLLVNVNQTGYYRVNYDEKNWNLIIKQLQTKNGHLAFDPKNRAQLLDDAMHLASAGYLDYGIALNVTKYLIQERDYIPWNAALDSLHFIHQMFTRTANFEKFKRYMLNLIGDFYTEIGFDDREGEDPLLGYSRYALHIRACELGLRDCIINAIRQFENWRNSPNPDKFNLIPEDMREIVYCTALRVGGQEEWDFAWQRYLNANVGNEIEMLLYALGCSKETWILSRFLDWTITKGSGIRKQDVARVFSSVANNPVGQDLAYRFLKINWDKIKAYLGTSSMSLNTMLASSSIKLNSQMELDDLKLFLKSKENDPSIVRTAKQAIETAEANVLWMNRNYEYITRWLTSVQIGD